MNKMTKMINNKKRLKQNKYLKMFRKISNQLNKLMFKNKKQKILHNLKSKMKNNMVINKLIHLLKK